MPKLICPFCKTNLDDVPNFGHNNRLCPNVECHELVVPKRVLDKEEKSEISKDDQPDCFSYYDGRESACRRCGVREQCAIEFEATRPECYGLHPNEFEECTGCLDASQCVEFLKSKKVLESDMAPRKKRTRVRRRPAAEVKPEPVEEEVVVEEEVEEEPVADDQGDLDYTAWTIPDLREELEVRELATNGRKSVLVKRLLSDDAELESGGEEPVEEEEPEPAPKTRRKRTRVKDVVEESVEEDEVPVIDDEAVPALAAVADTSEIVAAVLTQVAQAISAWAAEYGGPAVGPAVLAVAALAEAPAEPKSKGLRGKAYDEKVETPGYRKFDATDCGYEDRGWHDLSFEEKMDYAEDLDVDIEEHDNEKVMLMRLKPAVLKVLGITKYKKAYSTRAARKALKEGTN